MPKPINPARKYAPAADMPCFQNADQCEALLGIPAHITLEAVKRGCLCRMVDGRIQSGVLVRWLFSNLEALQCRDVRGQLKEAELVIKKEKGKQLAGENERAGEEIAKRIIAEKLLPIRTRLDTLPVTMAGRCNPADPEMARIELEHAVKEVLKGNEP